MARRKRRSTVRTGHHCTIYCIATCLYIHSNNNNFEETGLLSGSMFWYDDLLPCSQCSVVPCLMWLMLTRTVQGRTNTLPIQLSVISATQGLNRATSRWFAVRKTDSGRHLKSSVLTVSALEGLVWLERFTDSWWQNVKITHLCSVCSEIRTNFTSLKSTRPTRTQQSSRRKRGTDYYKRTFTAQSNLFYILVKMIQIVQSFKFPFNMF